MLASNQLTIYVAAPDLRLWRPTSMASGERLAIDELTESRKLNKSYSTLWKPYLDLTRLFPPNGISQKICSLNTLLEVTSEK